MKKLSVALFALLLLGGCQKRATVRAPLPPSPPNDFEIAESNFEKSNYSVAVHAFEAYLRGSPRDGNQPKALFHLGMSLALSGGPGRDFKEAEDAFKLLVARFPDSPYQRQAEYILRLQAQIERLKADVRESDEKVKSLTEELQKLKEIDMKRRPAKPPQ